MIECQALNDRTSRPCSRHVDGVHRCKRPVEELMDADGRIHTHTCRCDTTWEPAGSTS